MALGRGREPRRLAGVPDPVPDLRAARRGRHRGRHVSQRLEQVRAAADPRTAASRRLAGPVLARGVPAGPERAELPAPAPAQGRPGQAGHLLHPRLQPGVDQSGRAELDGGAHRRAEGGLLRGADPHLERVRLLRRLRAADGPRLRTARHPLLRAVRRAVGRRSASRSCARPASGSARPSRTPARSTRARCGRRTSSGSSCPGGSTRTARSASGNTTSLAPARVRSSPWTSTTAGCSSIPCRACPSGRRPRAGRRWSGCAATARSRSAAARARCTSRRSRPGNWPTWPCAGTAGRVYTLRPRRTRPTSSRWGRPAPDDQGRRPVGVLVDGVVRRGFPTPSGRLEFWSSTLAAWGWPEHALPGYISSHVHPSAAGPRPGGAAVHVPAADADPHPLGQQQVAGRAVPHQPGLDPPVRRGPVRGEPHRRPDPGGDRDRLLRGQGMDHRGHPAGRGRVLATTWAAGSCTGPRPDAARAA